MIDSNGTASSERRRSDQREPRPSAGAALGGGSRLAGVIIKSADAMTTMDADLLWDIRKRLSFSAYMNGMDTTFLGLLKKIDRTFERRDGQFYTAVNSKGFEVRIPMKSAAYSDGSRPGIPMKSATP